MGGAVSESTWINRQAVAYDVPIISGLDCVGPLYSPATTRASDKAKELASKIEAQLVTQNVWNCLDVGCNSKRMSMWECRFQCLCATRFGNGSLQYVGTYDGSSFTVKPAEKIPEMIYVYHESMNPNRNLYFTSSWNLKVLGRPPKFLGSEPCMNVSTHDHRDGGFGHLLDNHKFALLPPGSSSRCTFDSLCFTTCYVIYVILWVLVISCSQLIYI